ncbi:MAG: carbamoyl-phosphate synthase large subunit [Hydrogenoanaerobacterium sp.]
MGLRNDIKKVLVIGSGPIIIGQAAEFDYAGTQACRALKEEGLEVVLINSNPATIMTDKAMADKIYIEPLNLEVVKKIIEIEKPDSVLSTLGGQTGLTLSMQLAKEGFLESHNVKLLGAKPETIDKAEDRQLFKDTMEQIGEPCIPSKVVQTLDDALAFAKFITYPVIVRPAFTMGGTGGGIAETEDELREIAENGLRLSPITQILVEKCISGWKEIEFEVIRDSCGNCITVCSMENVDPVGVHTGDSIVVAPAVTLSSHEYNMLRTAALNMVNALGVEGGCNCQFALHPTSFEYAVIEVNPRVSRSSALASKATGYPIAKVATKIAVGYTLDEIVNAVTGSTYACFEPAIDYIVVKFPKWPFDKFVYAKRTLGTQMKATGEVMSIGTSFEQAMMKAVRSIELGTDTMNLPKLAALGTDEIEARLHNCDDERIFVVYAALKRGIAPNIIHKITMIDMWFLEKLLHLCVLEEGLVSGKITEEKYLQAKKYGFLDSTIKKLSGQEILRHRAASYKMVDTCAAEFAAKTPYFYSTFDNENEAEKYIKENHSGKQKILVFGSGPIRIGQGIEFDYCSVHCVWALKEAGCEAIIVNNNPETVSTDFDTADRLYFDPLTPEDVDSVIETEQPDAVVVQFGGQTAIKLIKYLTKKGIKILGTSADSIDAAEDRERFDELLGRCNIPRPEGHTVFTSDEAVAAANSLGYPVLLRPSYVLGGQNMIIAHSDADVVEYMAIILTQHLDNPVLIDKYLMGTEVEVDAICDGNDYLIPGIMEHIERAGVHSGDSISVYPTRTLSKRIRDILVDYTGKLARELKVVGLVNIQYVVYEGMVYVIEVNPRSSRTVPYISKVTGVPMVELATKIMLGASLKSLGFGTGLYPEGEYVAVKVPVFSFEKLHDLDTQLGPEMKSTGEVLGIAKSFEEALLKGLVAAGYKLKHSGGVLLSVRHSDQQELVAIAEKYEKLGFTLYATSGTALNLNRHMVAANAVRKLGEGKPDIIDLIESGKIDYVISTSAKGRDPHRDSVKIRRKAVERSICCFTSPDTANAMADCLATGKGIDDMHFVDITKI